MEKDSSAAFLAHKKALEESLQGYKKSPSKAVAYLESMKKLSDELKGRKS